MRRGSRTPLLLCQRHSPPNRQRSRRDLPHRQGHDQPNGLWLGLLHASHHCTLGSKRRSCNDLEPKSNCKQNVNLSQLSNNIQSDTKANTCITSCCKSTKASSLTEGVENMNFVHARTNAIWVRALSLMLLHTSRLHGWRRLLCGGEWQLVPICWGREWSEPLKMNVWQVYEQRMKDTC